MDKSRAIIANLAVTSVALLTTIVLQVMMAAGVPCPFGDSLWTPILIFLALCAALWLVIVFWRRDNG